MKWEHWQWLRPFVYALLAPPVVAALFLVWGALTGTVDVVWSRLGRIISITWIFAGIAAVAWLARTQTASISRCGACHAVLPHPYARCPDCGQAARADVIARCAGCGYELRGLSEQRCPECGEPVDPDRVRRPSQSP